MPDYGPGPGEESLIYDETTDCGYFGEVSASEFIDGISLAESIGVQNPGDMTDNIYVDPNAGWLKFLYHGKVIFMAKKNFLIWPNETIVEDLYSLGAFFGTDTYGLAKYMTEEEWAATGFGPYIEFDTYVRRMRSEGDFSLAYESQPWTYPINVEAPTQQSARVSVAGGTFRVKVPDATSYNPLDDSYSVPTLYSKNCSYARGRKSMFNELIYRIIDYVIPACTNTSADNTHAGIEYVPKWGSFFTRDDLGLRLETITHNLGGDEMGRALLCRSGPGNSGGEAVVHRMAGAQGLFWSGLWLRNAWGWRPVLEYLGPGGGGGGVPFWKNLSGVTEVFAQAGGGGDYSAPEIGPYIPIAEAFGFEEGH